MTRAAATTWAAPKPVDAKELKRVLESVNESGITELVLETSDYKLTVRRGGEVAAVPAAPPQVAQAAAPAPLPETSPTPTPTSSQPGAAPTPAATAPKEDKSNLLEVTAPIVGTLYAAPGPDTPDFVKVGDKVQAGSVLCIIEAMKLMNEIEAEVSGTVREILVKNEEPVEYGQALFRLEPA